MWWKLSGVAVLTAALIFVVIPIRTHAVWYDPASPPSPQRWNLTNVIANMYVTPGTLAVIAIILAGAAAIAFRIIRNS